MDGARTIFSAPRVVYERNRNAPDVSGAFFVP